MPDDVVETDTTETSTTDSPEAHVSTGEPKTESVFKPIQSQEEFEAALKGRLQRAERSAEKKSATQVAELQAKIKEHEDAKLSDEEKRNKRLKELEDALTEREQKITELERSKLVSEIAGELKLPKKLWGRVVGNTEDEVRADIEDIMSDLPKPPDTKKPPAQGGTVKVAPSGDNGEPAETADAILAAIDPRYR